MTRGQITVIAREYGEKDFSVLTSLEFNGDMYPSGHGRSVVLGLKKVKDIATYTQLVANFNANHHHYNDTKQIYKLDNQSLDFTKDYFDYWFSDYVYIKNITQENITITTKDGKTTLEPNDIARLCFGELEKVYKY